MNKILLVVDMQNDFVSGALGSEQAQAIVPNVVKAMKQYADFGYEIMLTQDTHHNKYNKEFTDIPVEHCIVGTQGIKFTEDIQIAINGIENEREDFNLNGVIEIVEKNTYGATDLVCTDQIQDATEIVVVGLCTDLCVISNVIMCQATAPNADIIVLEDCVAGSTKANHDTAIQAMKNLHIKVGNLND